MGLSSSSWGYPQISVENRIEIDDWGVPLFQEITIYIYIYIYVYIMKINIIVIVIIIITIIVKMLVL